MFHKRNKDASIGTGLTSGTQSVESKPNISESGSRRPGKGIGNDRDRDWTEGNILKNLVSLSWPMTVTQTIMSLGPTIDMIWVGKLGSTAVAGVGISGIIVQLAQGVMMGFTVGMRAMIARAIGSQDIHAANRIAQQAVIITAIYGIFMAIFGFFFGEKVIGLVTSDLEVIEYGTLYLRIQFIAGGTVVFRMMMDAIMQASGDSVNPMWIAIVYRLFHIALCPFLIFGWWVFPELGVEGAAYTSIIAQTLGIILGLRVLIGSRSRVSITFKEFTFDTGIIIRMIRIGLPSAISNVQQNLNQFFLQIFIAPFGGAAIAAHAIMQRLNMFIFMPTSSFGMGAGVLVGQNLGAGKPERAEKSAWIAVWLVTAFSVCIAVLFYFLAEPVIRIFNSEPDMVEMGILFIQIGVVSWLFMGFASVLMNCLQGAGDTIPTMVIAIVTTWAITMPLAYFLPKYTDWGIASIRWAISASSVIGALANIIYFRMGKWKTRRV